MCGAHYRELEGGGNETPNLAATNSGSVYLRPSGRWSAALTWKGEKHYLGTFDARGQAAAALADAKRRHGVPELEAASTPSDGADPSSAATAASTPTPPQKSADDQFEAKSEVQQMKSKIPSSSTSTKKPAAGKPAAVTSAEDHEMPQPTPESHWQETIDDSSGKPYYYHIVTNEVTWDKPVCLAALDDLPPSTKSTMRAKGITKVGEKWRAQICVKGATKGIGNFDTPQEAAAAYECLSLIHI